MKIVFIAPIPPPVNGNSLAAKVFLEELQNENDVEVIDLSKSSLKSGVSSLSRIKRILKSVFKVYRVQNKADLLYLTLAESSLGNIRDLFIFFVCFRKRNRMIVHMLGGAGMKEILSKSGLIYKLNNFFLSKIGAIVVEGWPQAKTFERVIDRNRIHIVPNFAEDFLFASEEELYAKYEQTEPLRILFLSNLLYGKGQHELVDGFLQLHETIRQNIRLTFVGGFESERDKQIFLKKIEDKSEIHYYGAFVSGYEKREMYLKSHIFCLPTYYPYEGQPISIIESYATGCVAMVTMHSGIPQIFEPGKNGYEVKKKSSDSIRKTIVDIWNDRESLKKIGRYNYEIASRKYRTKIYVASLMNIVRKITQQEGV